MVFKVYFQENVLEVPIRENTKTLYINGETERDVRAKLADRKLNIELVQPITGAYLQYEQKNIDFTVLEI